MSQSEQPGPSAEAPGQSVLSRISTEMVRLQKQYFGKGPERAKSYMVDDLLFIVMRGGVTTAEQTMLDSDQENLVRNFRQQFENELSARLIGMVEEVTGRKVVNYQSQIVFDPDIVFEIFIFDEKAGREQVRETAEAQLGDRSSGELTDQDVAADLPVEADR
ncbi:MAG: DUF2294 domain-containing protein [Actinomycetota bacterium]|nr:DUF2294 domain-containing protein [Actinomycetota bacterium]